MMQWFKQHVLGIHSPSGVLGLGSMCRCRKCRRRIKAKMTALALESRAPVVLEIEKRDEKKTSG